MANIGYATPVLFTKEKNVYILSARITFDALGGCALDTNNSKGFCAVWNSTPQFTAGTTNSTTTIGTVSSFAGLFPGMTITVGSSAALQASTTIGSITASGGTFVVNNQSIFSIPSTTFTVGSGGTSGQYILQLGTAAGVNLATYNKLLYVHHSWDTACGSMVGTATQSQLTPAAPAMLLIKNNTALRTVPPTLATNSTDASITVQFGTTTTNGLTAKAPAAGEAVRILMIMGASSAP